MPKDNTQAKMVFDYLIDFGSITPMEAAIDLGIMCLAERVRDLRRMGIDVKSVPETRKTVTAR